MSTFIVTLKKEASLLRTRNPFIPLSILANTNSPNLRIWEFEAKDEEEVRRLYNEAKASGLPLVQGFQLHEIKLKMKKGGCHGSKASREAEAGRKAS